MHHILAEIIQGGLVLETNVEEIDISGMCFSFDATRNEGRDGADLSISQYKKLHE